MSDIYERIATALEKTADFLDAQDAEKVASVQHERRQMIDGLSEQYATVTGEELSSDVCEKLAASDVNLLATFQKLAARVNSNNAPEDLGEPGEMSDGDPVYTTKKAELSAKTQAAGDSFLNFIMSE